jgi:23S rRNA U2552 (ribose-2'-O)-methylase RlmE/FtsJ
LNYGVITLVPKIVEASINKQFRTICLLNVDFKMFTKVLANRLSHVAKEAMGENQSGFVKDINILDGIVTLNEVL